MLSQQFGSDFHPSTQLVDPTQFPPNPQPGPSVPTSSRSRPKRKRTALPPADSTDNSAESAPGHQKILPKKKKANRACFHCQKAHLTCDDSRPCQRCIKRGLSDKCTEGLRKKAKYLLDDQELAALKQQQQQKSRQRTESGKEPTGAPFPGSQPLNDPQSITPDPNPDPLFNLAFDQAYTFGSEAANLEYSILSAILGNPSPPEDSSNLSSLPAADASASINVSYPQFASPDWPAPPSQPPPRASSTISPSFLQQQQQPYPESPYHPQPQQPQAFSTLSPPFPQTSPVASGSQNADAPIHEPQAQMYYTSSWDTKSSGAPANGKESTSVGPGASYLRTSMPGQPQGVQYQSPHKAQLPLLSSNHNQSPPSGQGQNQGLAPISPPPSNSSPGTPLAGEGGLHFNVEGQPGPRVAPLRQTQRHQTPSWGVTDGSSEAARNDGKGYPAAKTETNGRAQDIGEASGVYTKVTKRYDYTEGYHFLMRHLHARFDKNDILRVVRALAIVRPSLIAMQMPLNDEDEVFVEKCFQRSLLEMDKLMSFGGTPTVVWRRTGEICLVGFEFTMLTEWTREELLGRRKYIYELFENQSTVEYFEKFAAHTFENTTQSVISHCVLLKPSGAPVPCAFCFSIRRDIFDLPNMIIGQWLPLL